MHKRILLLILFSANIPMTKGVPPPPALQRMSTSDLLSLYDSTNEVARSDAIAEMTWRLENARVGTNINLPIGLVTKSTFRLLRQDSSEVVRIAAVNLFGELANWTNVTDILILASNDEDCLVRMRAIGFLANILHAQNEPVPPEEIRNLMNCLNSTNNSEVLWQAALLAKQIGKDAKPTIPLLQALSKYPDKKVRGYAIAAVRELKGLEPP